MIYLELKSPRKPLDKRLCGFQFRSENFIRFEIPAVVIMKISIFWDITACNLSRDQHEAGGN
jgi:hypothetical protein